MKINDLIVESVQLDEAPITQAVGKSFGKLAKGAAAIGKDLKTGFKAGYSGEQPPTEPAATTTSTQAAPAPTQAAPVTKAAPAPAAAPAAEPATSGEDVGKLKQQIASLTTDVQGLVSSMQADKQDMLTDISNLKQQVAKLVKPSQAEIDADRARLGVGGSESVSKADPSLAETLARKVQEQKQRMFETALANGQQSIFKK